MRTLVVIPTYDEAANIVDVLTRVRSALPDADVLVVDDAGPDGTADMAEEVGARLGRIEVMRRPAKTGLGPAYRAGYRHGLAAGYEVLVQMDADLSHDPAALPALLEPVLSGRADLSIGSRYVPGAAVPDWDRRRRLLSYCGNLYTRLWLGFRVRDATAGFRAYRAETVRAVGLDWVRSSGYAFQIEMTVLASRRGARIVEVPITFADRDLGRSKMSGRIVAEAVLLVTWWGVRRRLPPLAGLIRRLVRRFRWFDQGAPTS